MPPHGLSKDLIARALTYRLQERAGAGSARDIHVSLLFALLPKVFALARRLNTLKQACVQELIDLLERYENAFPPDECNNARMRR